MTVASFFNKTVIVKRAKTTSGYKQSLTTTATADASIQHLDREAAQRIGILEGRGWYAYFEEGTDVQEGDVITDKNTAINYKVREITNIDWGINRHMEVLVEELNA